MGLDETDISDDNGGKSLSSSNISCSICLELVTDNGDRSWAKLQCGHEFHLDCIGSAFNIKGAMQCPNCRKIEKGQWLYNTGCRSFSDIVDGWPHDDDLYDLSYAEMFGVQWCPVPAFSQLPSFEEGELPSTAYHEFLLGQHALYAEHTAVSTSTHQCPYVAYYGPIHSSSSNSVGNVSDSSNYSNHWAGPSGPSEMPSSYPYSTIDPHFQGWEHHSLNFSGNGGRLGASEQPSAPNLNPRSYRVNPDLQRSGSFVHPFVLSQSSGERVGSSVTSSMIPTYPGSAARARDRVQALQAYFQPPSSSPPMHPPIMSNTRRPTNHRVLAQGGPLPSSSDQTGSGFFVFPSSTSTRTFSEPENPPISSRFNGWERDHLTFFPLIQSDRDSSWLPHQVGGSSSFVQRHGSERTPSQHH